MNKRKMSFIEGVTVMYFYLVDVKSTKNVNGEDVALDYINTYLLESDAENEAKKLSKDEDTLEVGVFRWKLLENGDHEIDYGYNGFRFLNRKHRELAM